MVTKGLSRQVEEKLLRLQAEVEQARQDYSALTEQNLSKDKESDDLKSRMRDLQQERDSAERTRQSLASKLKEIQDDLNSTADEKALLQSRHDVLTERVGFAAARRHAAAGIGGRPRGQPGTGTSAFYAN